MKKFLRIICLPGIILIIFLFTGNDSLGKTRIILTDEKPILATANPMMPEPEQLYDFAKIDTNSIYAASLKTEMTIQNLIGGFSNYKSTERTFSNTMLPLDEIYNTLQKSTSVYELISQTSTKKPIRDLASKMLSKFTTVTDELLQNETLYSAVNEYAKTSEAKSLIGEKAFFVKRILLEFNLNGMSLSVEKRDTLKLINSRLNELGIAFGKNIADNNTRVELAKTELAGLPQDFIKPFSIAGNDQRYFFDLSAPTYNEFMMECSNTESRKKMYLARMNIGGVANENILVETIGLRTKKAKLLGFQTYAQYATSDIMAQNVQSVWSFENGLAKDLRPKAQKDLDQLLAIKTKTEGKNATEIYPYEAAYYSNLLLKEKFNVDPEIVKQYFEMKNALNGIFTVYQKLYNLRFVEDLNASVWHKDVKAYTVFSNATNERIGYFYLDLYPRENKYNHFGCFGITGSKSYSKEKKQLRSAALVCNFPPSTTEKPSLLPHSQVITFFHEFGHLIHNLLSETELAYFAGTNVATDFVEAPSQIMENWVWQKDVLSLFAKHYKTGKTIPDELLDNMIAARNLNSGLNTLQQVYYGTLDFTLNDGYAPKSAADIVSKTKELQNSITLYPYVEGSDFAGSFGHLIGYGSKYYGYLWSLVYAADMFSEFQNTGILNPETGNRYRENVLAKGGSDNAVNLVKNFLGREPNNLAFLKQIGL